MPLSTTELVGERPLSATFSSVPRQILGVTAPRTACPNTEAAMRQSNDRLNERIVDPRVHQAEAAIALRNSVNVSLGPRSQSVAFCLPVGRTA